MLYYVHILTTGSATIRACLVQAPNAFVAVMYVLLHNVPQQIRTEIRDVQVEPFYTYLDQHDGDYRGFHMYTVPKNFEYNPGGEK